MEHLSRGRRSEISDAQLHNRRDALVEIFEGEWAEIGGKLARCKKPDDLIRLFTPVVKSQSWISAEVELFHRPSSEPTSGTVLRNVRAQIRCLAEPLYAAEQASRLAKEKLDQVTQALAQAQGSDRRHFKRLRKQRRKQSWKAAIKNLELINAEQKLKVRIRGLESSLARAELLRFVRSKRYELMPLNLANAVAGLPHMGWRQSMRRNRGVACPVANGMQYQVFKAIRYLATAARRQDENAFIRFFQKSISSLPSRHRSAQVELAENWFFLERALRLTYRTKPLARELPFEITNRYVAMKGRILSPVQLLLASEAKIRLGD